MPNSISRRLQFRRVRVCTNTLEELARERSRSPSPEDDDGVVDLDPKATLQGASSSTTPLWLTSATLHPDESAALWLQSYTYIAAVEAEFGTDDHRKFIKALLALKQKGSAEEYQEQFQKLV